MDPMDILVRDTIQLVDLQNKEGFKKIFTDLCNENKRPVAAELATRILAEQEAALLQPIPNRERYEFTLKNLKDVFPFIKDYFSKDSQRKNDPMEGLGIHAISSKGQRAIVQEMTNRNDLNGKTVVVSEDFSKFKKSIASFFANAGENEETLFLVRHRKSKGDLARHTSSVHIQKKNDIFRLFVTDSQGGPQAAKPTHTYMKNVIKFINEGYIQSRSTTPIQINYDAGNARLSDGSNCVIIALRDGLEMIRNTENVYTQIEGDRVQMGSSNEYAVSHLPLRMVKTAQSLTYIERYLQETHQENTLLCSSKKLQGETIPNAIRRHSFVGVDPRTNKRKLFNGKVAHTYLKYERHIVANCIKNGK